MECIVTGPRMFPYRDPKFWDAYRDVPAWNFERFAEIAERGKPFEIPRVDRAQMAQREREDLEASLAHVKGVLGL
jgi:3-oxoisoapionate decarboxylase